MAYSIGLSEINSITESDLFLSTSRFLPSVDDIPENIISTPYYDFVNSTFYGHSGHVDFKLRMRVAPLKISMLIDSHLSCPDYPVEHRLRGVAYMLSFIIKLKP